MEDPWPSAPWLLPFLCTFDVCLFTTGSDCPLVIAGVDFLSKQGDDVRDPGWDLANFEICWKAAAAHPTFFQLIFKCVFFSLWNQTVSLTTTFDVEMVWCFYKWGMLIMESRSLIPFDRYQPVSHSHTQHMIQDCLETCQTDPRARGPRFPNNCVTGQHHQYVYRKWIGKSYEDGGRVILNHTEGHWAVPGNIFVLAVLIAWLSLVLVPLWAFGWASMVTHFGRLRQTLWMFYEGGFWKNGASTMTFSEWVSEKQVGYLKM